MLSVKRVCSLSFFGTNGIQIFMSINGISGNYRICKAMYSMASYTLPYMVVVRGVMERGRWSVKGDLYDH